MITLYGIKHCDTVKKALKQLDSQKIAYQFVDLKTTLLASETIQDWLSQCPDTLINKRSTTYRQLKTTLMTITDEEQLIAIIQTHPTLIKRPVMVLNHGEIIVGFDKVRYQALA